MDSSLRRVTVELEQTGLADDLQGEAPDPHELGRDSERDSESEPERDSKMDMDQYDVFCAQAGYRRLSSSREYGGSLPCIPPRSPIATKKLKPSSSPHSPLYQPIINISYLAVPSLPMMRRAHSDEYHNGQVGFSEFGALSPPAKRKSRPMKIWSSLKSLVDSCEGSPGCLSPGSPPFERFDQAGVSPRCVSAPHSRSSSVKRRRRVRPPRGRPTVQTSITFDLADDIRPRTGSFPGQNRHKRPNNLTLGPSATPPAGVDGANDDWQRVRHFVITPKGIVNCGDSFRTKSASSSLRSLGSLGSGLNINSMNHRDGWQGSNGSFLSQSQDLAPLSYRVRILGAAGVGKTTLAQQFLTSESLVEKESLNGYEDCSTVNVLLDGEEAQLEILDEAQEITKGVYSSRPQADATLVTYSTVDRTSFHHAMDTLYDLGRDFTRQDAVILVANKIDLVRNRQVAEQEGKSAAEQHDCKYFEVSALMSLRVDELLAGIVNQIRLHGNAKNNFHGNRNHHADGRKSPLHFINRILNRQDPVSKSCDNLLVL